MPSVIDDAGLSAENLTVLGEVIHTYLRDQVRDRRIDIRWKLVEHAHPSKPGVLVRSGCIIIGVAEELAEQIVEAIAKRHAMLHSLQELGIRVRCVYLRPRVTTATRMAALRAALNNKGMWRYVHRPAMALLYAAIVHWTGLINVAALLRVASRGVFSLVAG